MSHGGHDYLDAWDRQGFSLLPLVRTLAAHGVDDLCYLTTGLHSLQYMMLKIEVENPEDYGTRDAQHRS